MSKAIIVYWTGSGNTEIMAEKIKDGIDSCGYDVKMCMVDEIESEELLTYNNIIFGCPSMGEEILEETEFEPFFSEIEKNIENKNIALFGSYGWGDGEWMKTWEERVRNSGAILFKEGLIINYTPEEEDERICENFGKEFGEILK